MKNSSSSSKSPIDRLTRDGCSQEIAEKICKLIQADPNARAIFEAMKRGTLLIPATNCTRRERQALHVRSKKSMRETR